MPGVETHTGAQPQVVATDASKPDNHQHNVLSLIFGGGVGDASGVGRGVWGGLASPVTQGVWAVDRYRVVFSANGGIGYGLIDSYFDFVRWCL